MSPTPQFEGVKVNAGGRELVLPALNLGALKRLREQFKVISGIDPATQGATLTDAQVDAMTDIILASVRRNYPEITREEIEELVDLNNLPSAIEAILGQSGFAKRTQPGEAGSP